MEEKSNLSNLKIAQLNASLNYMQLAEQYRVIFGKNDGNTQNYLRDFLYKVPTSVFARVADCIHTNSVTQGRSLGFRYLYDGNKMQISNFQKGDEGLLVVYPFKQHFEGETEKNVGMLGTFSGGKDLQIRSRRYLAFSSLEEDDAVSIKTFDNETGISVLPEDVTPSISIAFEPSRCFDFIKQDNEVYNQSEQNILQLEERDIEQ